MASSVIQKSAKFAYLLMFPSVLLTDPQQRSIKKSKASVVAFQRTDANPDGSAGRNNFEGFNTKRVYSVVGKTRALDKMIAHPVVMGLLHQWLLPNYLLTAAQVAWLWHEEAEFFQY